MEDIHFFNIKKNILVHDISFYSRQREDILNNAIFNHDQETKREKENYMKYTFFLASPEA